MDVIELIKKQRYFTKALKILLTSEQRLEVREQTRYLLVDPSSEQASSDKASRYKEKTAADIKRKGII